ncbi:LysM peptidoglycan-binding domain-containing protein [Lactobacillus crispatus]|uniref:aggregation-promoting factor n=1 Tax=Lactobacillus crispatus TaxID=47770 RepID=UPI000DF9A230|nr:LysM peptidoglycan-binding domain-containing protein [Lactobacillus crispatus]STX18458.1 LysM domain-containing protein [Lactobacillus acidophilus]MCT7731268.1 LysM peptidoglycan-binding domain-containing protein [Lactobacillus crispatus]MCT7802797.1 LysM peptidoglycan-binding domain-containing protein [Lactobacillus crispatus]MCT7808102.1 LysM peptidoglycan-binding domain-containing protein [Lactobacillus crispatus]MCT7816767.1 LysM peptidoglycan-binding domain-containing protein [Lactobac
MKLSLRQAILFLVGGVAGAVGVQQTSTTAHAEVVTVHKNDTTWKISKDHHTTVHQIVKDNHLKDGGSKIYVGQKLDVNKPGTKSKNNHKTSGTTAYADTIATQNNGQNNNYGSTQTNYSTYNNAQGQSSYSNQYKTPVSQAPKSSASNYQSTATGSEAAAKAWIAARESGGSYSAVNKSSGAYGKYQLLPGYLHGDYSPANQERTADNYVHGRYGSWQNAKAFWQANGWY